MKKLRFRTIFDMKPQSEALIRGFYSVIASCLNVPAAYVNQIREGVLGTKSQKDRQSVDVKNYLPCLQLPFDYVLYTVRSPANCVLGLR